MPLKPLNCPHCGAQISIDDHQEFGFCSYCGTKIQVGERINVNVNHLYPNGAPSVNNINIEAEKKPTITIKKPGAARVVWGVIFIVFGIMFLTVLIAQTLEYPQTDMAQVIGVATVSSFPFLLGGTIMLISYFVSLSNYNKLLLKATELGIVTNK